MSVSVNHTTAGKFLVHAHAMPANTRSDPSDTLGTATAAAATAAAAAAAAVAAAAARSIRPTRPGVRVQVPVRERLAFPETKIVLLCAFSLVAESRRA